MREPLPLNTPTRTPEELEAAYAKGLVRKEELVHGMHYWGKCRHAEIARWHAGAGQFAYIREKCGNKVLAKIRHPVDDKHTDVFLPVEAVENPTAGRIEDDALESLFAQPFPIKSYK